MTETLVEFFLDIFSGMTGSELGKCVSVFIVSMLPIIEFYLIYLWLKDL